jgi:ABC-type branched-chain amino acid transport systems, ATPase component
MLEVQNLVKKFGSNIALNNVSFASDRPEVIGIIGRSGAVNRHCSAV